MEGRGTFSISACSVSPPLYPESGGGMNLLKGPTVARTEGQDENSPPLSPASGGGMNSPPRVKRRSRSSVTPGPLGTYANDFPPGTRKISE